MGLDSIAFGLHDYRRRREALPDLAITSVPDLAITSVSESQGVPSFIAKKFYPEDKVPNCTEYSLAFKQNGWFCWKKFAKSSRLQGLQGSCQYLILYL